MITVSGFISAITIITIMTRITIMTKITMTIFMIRMGVVPYLLVSCWR